MRVVELPAKDLREALETIDALRDDIENGKIKAFFAVGVARDHTTYQYSSAVEKTTELERMGACYSLLACGG